MLLSRTKKNQAAAAIGSTIIVGKSLMSTCSCDPRSTTRIASRPTIPSRNAKNCSSVTWHAPGATGPTRVSALRQMSSVDSTTAFFCSAWSTFSSRTASAISFSPRRRPLLDGGRMGRTSLRRRLGTATRASLRGGRFEPLSEEVRLTT